MLSCLKHRIICIPGSKPMFKKKAKTNQVQPNGVYALSIHYTRMLHGIGINS